MLPPPVSMLVQDSGAGMGPAELAHPPAAGQTPGDHHQAALLEGGGRAPPVIDRPWVRMFRSGAA